MSSLVMSLSTSNVMSTYPWKASERRWPAPAAIGRCDLFSLISRAAPRRRPWGA